MANFVSQSTIGVQLGNSDGATALFGVGQHITANNGAEWIYVQATSALTTGTVVAVNTSYIAIPANATNLFGVAGGVPNSGSQLAFAQGTFAAADFGWVCVRGQPMYVLVSNVSTLGAALYINAGFSGSLTTAAASGTIAGVILLTASATGVLNPVIGYLQYPRLQAGALFGV